MRIAVHDYCGHPFPTQLSRRLATLGSEVVHVYSQSVVSPQGLLERLPNDPPSLSFSPIALPSVIDRQAFVRRYLQERRYGQLLARRLHEIRPHVVISGNAPLEAQARCLDVSRSLGAAFIFWLQDVHGVAIERLLTQRLGALGRLIGLHYRRVEKRLLRRSDAVIAIAEDFRPTLLELGVEESAVQVIPNWASTDELPVRAKDNNWARKQGLVDKFSFLYSGTLGMKHNPDLLLQLAMQYRDSEDVRVVVVSEGTGAEWLRSKGSDLKLRGLSVFPFQPYLDYPDVMGSADVLVAILEPDAGVFSVPSKILSYLCAGRPILLAVPPENLAARTIVAAKAGVVADSQDVLGFLREAERLRTDSERRLKMRRMARVYAEEHFDIGAVTEKFQAVISQALARRRT